MAAPRALVTGATGGIGREVALGLARRGHHVTLLGRDPGRLVAAAAFIAAAAPDAPAPDLLRADLSSLAGTAAAAAELRARGDRLDVLVNNAGVLSPRRTETAEGHELTLAVNHLSPFLLARALLPALRAANGTARVVMVGSSTADRARIDPADLELRRRWRMTRAYARSKLAMQLCAVDLAPDFAAAGVAIDVVHPGLVATDLVRAGGIDEFVWRHVLRRFALSPADGAAAPLRAALDPELGGGGGRYLDRLGLRRPNRRVRDAALRARVRRETERLLGTHARFG